MSDSPLTTVSGSTRRAGTGWLRKLLGRMHRDESGATLTEFVIVLPIFVLIFNGVMILGQYTRKGSELPIRAYKETFDRALRYQKSFFAAGWNVHASTAAVDAEAQLTGFASESSPAHNSSTAVEVAAYAAEGVTYAAMGVNGTMGESQVRAKTVGTVANLKGCKGVNPGTLWSPAGSTECIDMEEEDVITSDLRKWVGDSDYAYELLNDGPDASAFSGGGGGSIFSALNDAITAAGVRPALAAGIRYGTVSGYEEQSYSFGGITMDMSAHFSTLVPPGTTGGGQGPRVDALRATAVSRMTMQAHDHYAELPGIQWDQPLDSLGSKNFTVDDYPDY